MDINKVKFFRDLDSLGCVSDNDDDYDDDTQRIRGSPGLMKSTTTTVTTTNESPVPKVKNMPSSKRTQSPSSSAPGPGTTRVMETHAAVDVDKSHELNSESLTKRSAQASRSEQTIVAKKRRTRKVQNIPESEQIFRGLRFFFIPNNDISPARRLRIQKSQDYGALWAQAWSSDVTHVIVDKGLDYREILKVLTPEQLTGNRAIVNQDYISDCLAFRSILRVTQVRFRIDGFPETSCSVEGPLISTTASDVSLPIKEPRRLHRRSVTPSQRELIPANNLPATGIQHEATVATECQPEQREPDLLDELMLEVKATQDLPLDDHDEEAMVDMTVEVSIEADEPESSRKLEGRIPEWQKSFTCVQKHDAPGMNNNPNARTIETLQKMADYYSRTADNWRTIAYRKAIAALRKQETKICTKVQALAIPSIGQRLADKIEEIVSTDRLRRLDSINWTPEDMALQLFLGIYGVGFAQASKWVAIGYKSLDDLQMKANLTASQKVGVERYDDFQQRIPRAEVALHGNIVRAAVQSIDPDMEVMVTGSYRRGAADCGDIDLLITKPTGTLEYIRTVLLDTVVPALTRKGFLKVSLATTSRSDGSKWHGASALPDNDVWRRIDLLFVPGSEIGAALLYFTGNDIFNRSLRLLARKKGMRLNQRGLYKDVLRGPDQVKVTSGNLLESRDEKRIFEILGVPWRPPEHRIC